MNSIEARANQPTKNEAKRRREETTSWDYNPSTMETAATLHDKNAIFFPVQRQSLKLSEIFAVSSGFDCKNSDLGFGNSRRKFRLESSFFHSGNPVLTSGAGLEKSRFRIEAVNQSVPTPSTVVEVRPKSTKNEAHLAQSPVHPTFPAQAHTIVLLQSKPFIFCGFAVTAVNSFDPKTRKVVLKVEASYPQRKKGRPIGTALFAFFQKLPERNALLTPTWRELNRTFQNCQACEFLLSVCPPLRSRWCFSNRFHKEALFQTMNAHCPPHGKS